MKVSRIIECVPNFSEGRNPQAIQEISDEIRNTPGVKLMHVDPGQSTNRTVMTFAGTPEDVIEAAFRAIKKAALLINMNQHKGEHPRMGATDVCPLIPITGVSMEEAISFSHQLAQRVALELYIPVYLYEKSASESYRTLLADIRAGEYEGLPEKMKLEAWKPDYGPSLPHPTAGATVIGVRDFLIAYNVNLNTKSVPLANEISFDIRENGRPQRDPGSGKLMRDERGEILRIPGKCQGVKAIGWYIDEYKFAQVSMNLTDSSKTTLHEAFEQTRMAAETRGILATGSELVGLVPLKSMLDAGKYFLQKQNRSQGVSDAELIETTIQSLGLNSIQKFEPAKRIIEYMLEEKKVMLKDLSIESFVQEVASESPAPGGGSAAALCGTLGASLATMVANLTAHKKGYESQFQYFSDSAQQGQAAIKALQQLIDEDSAAFNRILEAFRLPKSSPEEKRTRKKAIQAATIYATDVPYRTVVEASNCFPLVEAMARNGNPNSRSDAGVGALCIRTAVEGAALNVFTNCPGIDDLKIREQYISNTQQILAEIRSKTDLLIEWISQSFLAPQTNDTV